MAGTIGVPELAILAFIGILFFGSQRIPALFRSMGRAKGEFQQGLREGLVGATETRWILTEATGPEPLPR